MALYLALSFGLAVGVTLVILNQGGITGPLVGLVYLFMFTPAISALLTRLLRREGFGDAGLRWGRGRWYLYAWLLSVAMVAAVYGAAWLLGQARFGLTMARFAGLGGGYNVGNLKPPPPGFTESQFLLLAALANLTVMNIPGIVLGLGEEFGWRGYLLPRLLPLGRWTAFVLMGVIWWAWHLPLSALQAAPADAAALALNAVTGILCAICIGGVLAWVRYSSRSIFPVALAHIVYNNGNSAFFLLFAANGPAVQIGTFVVTALAFALIAWRGGFRTAPEGAAVGEPGR